LRSCYWGIFQGFPIKIAPRGLYFGKYPPISQCNLEKKYERKCKKGERKGGNGGKKRKWEVKGQNKCKTGKN
jgi:hypothetical protein